MTERAASKLEIGDRVMWDDNPADTGEVIEKGYNAVKIKWERTGTNMIHLRGMKRVEKL